MSSFNGEENAKNDPLKLENAKNDPLKLVSQAGKVLLEVDVRKSKLWDINRHNAVYQMLLWAAATGKISDVIGSPPTETWINAVSEGKAGYPLVKRTLEEPHGIEGLPPLQQQHLNRETAAMAKQMFFFMDVGRLVF